MSMLQKRPSPDRALQKIKHYCAYQERSHAEVKEKLYSFGLWKNDVEDIISQLILDDYLNEERFACMFARGKFRMKQWGRVKIKYELNQKGVSEYCIKKGLMEIPEVEYMNTLSKLTEEKLRSPGKEKYSIICCRKDLNAI